MVVKGAKRAHVYVVMDTRHQSQRCVLISGYLT